MTSIPIVSRLNPLKQAFAWGWQAVTRHHRRGKRPNLHQLAQNPHLLPRFVRESAVAMRYLRLLEPLDWGRFPERDIETDWGAPTVPYASFAAACLVKLDQQFAYMSHLHRYLVEHPALVWVLGFPLVPSIRYPWGFDVQASLPTPRHFTRMLRKMDNPKLQSLLDETVRLLQVELSTEVDDFGQCISLDTKHILAWVRENNQKDYVQDRYDKEQQPAGDPDCRLGCKRRRNQRASSKEPPPTLPDNPVPPNISIGEYYWGYASGVIATKVPDWGEFVLAELTLPFDQPDVAYFHPLVSTPSTSMSTFTGTENPSKPPSPLFLFPNGVVGYANLMTKACPCAWRDWRCLSDTPTSVVPPSSSTSGVVTSVPCASLKSRPASALLVTRTGPKVAVRPLLPPASALASGISSTATVP